MITTLSLRRFVVNRLAGIMPPTRLYGFRSLLWRSAGVQASPKARLVSSVRIWTSGPVSIGADTFLGHEVAIIGGDATVEIGARCDLAPRVLITTGTHEDGGAHRAAGPGVSKPIIIRDGAWIGAGSIVLGGVVIGEGAMVAAGSVVRESVPARHVVAGVPARRIRIRSEGPPE